MILEAVISQRLALEVEAPDEIENLDDWADHCFAPFWGASAAGDVMATITACDDRRDLVGQTFEWDAS